MTRVVGRRAVLAAIPGALLGGCSASGRRPRPLGLLRPAPPREAGERVVAALLAGNRRFVAGTPLHSHDSAEALLLARAAERPLAVIVGCADSRVAPEVLFDQGLGDLFVVRSFGGVLDAAGLASVEYAVIELGVRVIVVLGHERCAAIGAAVAQAQAKDGSLPLAVPTHPPQLGALLQQLEPAARAALDTGASDVEEATMRRVLAMSAAALLTEPALSESGALTATARYDLDDATVQLLA